MHSPDAAGDLIYFSVEGGFGNLGRSLAISADGATRLTVSGHLTPGRLADGDLARLTQALDESRLFGADHNYEPTGGADLQRYEIRYGGHTVVAHDTSVPNSLQPALHLLEAALRSQLRPA